MSTAMPLGDLYMDKKKQNKAKPNYAQAKTKI